MMKQFEGALCAACLISGEYAECTVCPMRVKDAEREDNDAERELKTAGLRQDCKDGRSVKSRQRHQTSTISLYFPDYFRAKIKGDSMNELLKLFKSWKQLMFAESDLINACDTAIAQLKCARECGGLPKAAWWKERGNLMIRLDFSNHEAVAKFKKKLAA